MSRHQMMFCVAIALATLTSSPTSSQQPAKQRSSKEQLLAIGWVQADGEVRIYANKADLGKLYDGSCISGTMSRGRTMPKRFQNHLVRVYGTFISREELDDMALRAISIGVENYCASDKIAIITRMVEIK